jgi:hypothetical protein
VVDLNFKAFDVLNKNNNNVVLNQNKNINSFENAINNNFQQKNSCQENNNTKVLHMKSNCFFVAPSMVLISIFERNFFSDNKLGDVEINLNDLTENRFFLFNFYLFISIYLFCLFVFRSKRIKTNCIH